MPIERGKLALAMLVSISEGLCLEGLLGAILFRALADMSAAGEVSCRLVERKVATCRGTNWTTVMASALLNRRLAPALVGKQHALHLHELLAIST